MAEPTAKLLNSRKDGVVILLASGESISLSYTEFRAQLDNGTLHNKILNGMTQYEMGLRK